MYRIEKYPDINICDHLSKTHIVRTCIFKKKQKNKIYKLFVKLRMLQENIYRIDGANNQQKLYTILLAWLWRVWKIFVSAWTMSVSCAFV